MEAPALTASSEGFDRPDTLFAFVAGLYIALLVSPAFLLAVAVWLTASGRIVAVGLLLTVPTVVAAGSVAVRRFRGLPERLGGTALAWLLSLLGGAAALLYFAVGVTDSVPPAASGVGIAGFFCGLGAGILGAILVVMSRTRYTKALVDESTVDCTWTAGWPRRRRRIVWTIAGLAILVNVVTVLWAFLASADAGFNMLGIAVAAVLVGIGQERTYRVTEAGLERRNPAARQLFPWRAFSGVRTTADAVVIERRSPFRLDIHCARADIEDVDAVVAAVSAHVEDG